MEPWGDDDAARRKPSLSLPQHRGVCVCVCCVCVLHSDQLESSPHRQRHHSIEKDTHPLDMDKNLKNTSFWL